MKNIILFISVLTIGLFLTTDLCAAGAGVYIDGAGKLTNCYLFDNSNTLDGESASRGGAIAISGEGAEVNGCHIERNHAGFYGCAIYLINGSASIVNSTIVGNKCYGNSSAYATIYTENNTTLSLNNCVVWGNKQQTGSPNLANFGGGTILANHCALEGTEVYPGTGNIALSSTNTDLTGPNFESFIFNNSQDVHLTAASPLRGAGNADLVPASLTADLEGKPRKYGNYVDIGAYQSYSPISLSGKTVTYNGVTQGVDVPQFFNTEGTSVSQPGEGVVTYTYYKDGTSLGVGIVPKDAGTYDAVASFSGGSGFPAGKSNRVAFAIDPKDITVTALGGSSDYGDSPTNPGFSAAGLVNNETESVLTNLGNDFNITPTTPAGTYTLNVTGDLTNGNYNITQRNTGTWIVNKQTPPPPPSFTVNLTADEGIILNPSPGVHAATVGGSFTFYITLAEGYEGRTPTVLVNGDPVTIQLRPNGYEWMYTIPRVNDDTRVHASFHTTGNDTPDGPRLYSREGKLFIETATPTSLTVYSAAGQALVSRRVTEGLTVLPLPSGIYIVKTDQEVRKISIRN